MLLGRSMNSKSANDYTYYEIKGMGKPRMTKKDVWAKRPCVLRYWAFKDECRLKKVWIPDQHHFVFVFPMAKSWSKAKRAEHLAQKHLLKPDKDNAEKALMDAVLEEDSHIWDGRVTKLWGVKGFILIGTVFHPDLIGEAQKIIMEQAA